MLSEWYFCCCIKSTPERTRVFLSLLDALENSVTFNKTLLFSMEEISRTDMWMQIYAIPRVLRTLHGENKPQVYKDAVREFIRGIVGHLPDHLSEPFDEIVGYVLTGDVTRACKLIRSGAEAVNRLPRRIVGSVPYLDLKEFLPETLLLAITLDQLYFSRESDTRVLIGQQDYRGLSPIEELIERSVEYDCGRLPFLLSLQTAPLLSDKYAVNAMRERILKARPRVNLSEPDIVWIYFMLYFRLHQPLQGTEGVKQLVERIAEEARLHNQYSKKIQQLTDGKSNSQRPYVRMGFDEQHLDLCHFSPIVRQLVLWELAATVDAETAALNVPTVWQMTASGGTVSRPKQRIKELSPSPWMPINVSGKGQLFSDYQNGLLLLRLFSSAITATKLLQSLSEGCAKSEPVARLIVQCFHVIGFYNKWLNDYSKLEGHFKCTMTLPLTGFALYCRDLLTIVGAGNINSITPAHFLRLIKYDDEYSKCSKEEILFMDRVLPSVLTNWLQTAYQSAVEGFNPSVRWLSGVEQVTDFVVQSGSKDEPQIRAALLERYLSRRQLMWNCPTQLDWRVANRQPGKEGWLISHRYLLLTPTLPPSEWLRTDWTEPAWESETQFAGTRIVRAIERLSSLKSSEEPLHLLKEEWLLEFRDCLNGITDGNYLDRFIRLRLIEFIDDPAIEDSAEDQELISDIILEYGSIYDLSCLLSLLFPFEKGEQAKTRAARDQSMRTCLAHAVMWCNMVNLEVSHEKVKSGRRRALEDQKLELLVNFLSRIAYCGWKYPGNEVWVELRKTLLKCYNEFIFPKKNELSIGFTVDEGEGICPLRLTGSSLSSLGITGAIVDINNRTGSLFFREYFVDPSKAVNFFILSREEVRILLDSRDRHLVLATVLMFEEKETGFRYEFNCGLYFSLRLVSRKRLSLHRGDLVAVPICKTTAGTWTVTYPTQDLRKIYPVQGRIVAEVMTEEHYTDQGYFLRVEKEGVDCTADVNIERWQPDYSILFRKKRQSPPYKCHATKGKDGLLVPFNQDLILLITNLFGKLKCSSTILTFVEETLTSSGEKAWILSSRAGESYLLTTGQFVDKDIARIEEAAETARNAYNTFEGLLVAVTVITDISGRVKLGLVDSANMLDPRNTYYYPQIQVPFDARNLTWRCLFDKGQTTLARKEGNSWFVEYEDALPPEFPHRVKVNLEGSFSTKHPVVEIMISEWDCRRVVVTANIIRFDTLLLSDYKAFIKTWLNPVIGDLLTIAEAVDRFRIDKKTNTLNDKIRCITEERMSVLVEAASLTMDWMKIGENIHLGEGRLAEIVEVISRPSDVTPFIDPLQIPRRAIIGSGCKGILIKAPKPYEKAARLYTVLWETDGLPHKDDLSLLEADAWTERLELGAKLVGRQVDGKWSFTLEKIIIHCRALWRLGSSEIPGRPMTYLGEVVVNGDSLQIAQSAPGELVSLQSDRTLKAHLAVGYEGRFVGGLSPDYRFRNKAWKPRTRQSDGPLMLIGEKGFLAGWGRGNFTGSDLSISGTNLRLVPNRKNSKYYALIRSFWLAWQREQPKAQVGTNEQWGRKLREHLDAPYHWEFSTPAKLRGQTVLLEELRVPSCVQPDMWTFETVMAEGEYPYVMNAAYIIDGSSGDVRIFYNEKTCRHEASCRRILPYSLGEFVQSFGPVLSGMMIDFNALSPKINLYYVGPEEQSSGPAVINESGSSDVFHRFEWGPGRSLLVHSSRLRFKRHQMKTSEFVLFHGDMIRAITLWQGGDESQLEDFGQDDWILEIEDINIVFSQDRQLYRQRKEHRLLHNLHVVHDQGKASIDFIEGLDEEQFKSIRVYERTNACLDKDSERRLADEMSKDKEETNKRIVLGRLDVSEYEKSSGKTLVFGHVRLTFEKSAGSLRMQSGELVFLTAGKIVSLRNDFGLEVSPDSGIKKIDKGADFFGERKEKKLLLLRRSFTVRESVLRTLFNSKRDSELNDDILLVRVTEIQGRPPKISVMEKMPSRPSRNLASAIRLREELSLLTIVENDVYRMRLEVTPGIYCDLKREEIISSVEHIERGDIVRVECIADGHFSVQRATFSDRRYLSPEILRPAVALPKNDLLKNRADVSDVQWIRKNIFSIAGLPNIEAATGTIHVQNNFPKSRDVGGQSGGATGGPHWRNANMQDGVSLMEIATPKIVWLGLDQNGQVKVATSKDEIMCGSLCEGQNSDIFFLPPPSVCLGNSVPVVRLEWRFLTFADEGIQDVLVRSKVERWCYHDNETGYWDLGGQFQKEIIAEYDIFSGHLFFETHYAKPVLRYSRTFWNQFGFPFEELRQSLLHKEDSIATYTIVGVSDDREGLWLELAPGRIAEVPIRLLRLPAENRSFEDFAWDSVATGDRMRVRLSSRSELTVGTVILEEWLPGSRKIAPETRSILPVCDFDSKKGSLRLGAGQFQIVLPIAGDGFPWRNVVLHPDNEIEDGDETSLKPGDVVLLGIKEGGGLGIMGFSWFSALPSFMHMDYWTDDPLMHYFVNSDHGKPAANWHLITELVSSIGGAIPVTIEGVDLRKKIIFYSRRYQIASSVIPPQRWTIGKVLGFDGERFFLKVGAGLMAVEPKCVVSGLPPRMHLQASKVIKNFGLPLFMHKTVDNILRGGLGSEDSAEIEVNPLMIVSRNDDGDGEYGLICRSLKTLQLYWLPETHTGWLKMAGREIVRVLESNRKMTFRVKLLTDDNNGPFCSVIDASEVRKTLATLEIGSELSVRILGECAIGQSEAEGIFPFIASPTATNVLLVCESEDGLPKGTELAVVVNNIIKSAASTPRVTVVPVGKRRFTLDLPSWMSNSEALSGKETEESVNLRRWMTETNVPVDIFLHEISGITLSHVPDADLDRLLCLSYNVSGHDHNRHNYQQYKTVVEEWLIRNREKRELCAAKVIISILLIERVREFCTDKNEWRRLGFDVLDLIRKIGGRALRSLHCEILSAQWICTERIHSRPAGLWLRLQRVASIISKKFLTISDIQEIRHFCNAIMIRSQDKDLVPIAHALLAATGDLKDISVLRDRAVVSRTLAEMAILLPSTLSGFSPFLQPYDIIQLKELLMYILSNGFQITLLDAIPIPSACKL